jgi:type II secretory pathway component PulM
LLFTLTWPPIHIIGPGMKRQPTAFKLSKRQATERDVLAADLREKGTALNAAIAVFNQAIEPLSRPVIEALEDYNATLEKARALAGGITEAAQDIFDARPERWQQSDKGIKVRIWIEQWEVSLDDLDLDLPEPLTEVDLEQQAAEIEGPPSAPSE